MPRSRAFKSTIKIIVLYSVIWLAASFSAEARAKDKAEDTKKPGPATPTPAQKKKIKQHIDTIEAIPSGVIINNRGEVEFNPGHRPYNPDGSRNQDFKVVPGDAENTIEQKNRRERGLAVKALIKTGRPAVPQVVAALMEEGNQYRHLYAYVLGEIGDPRAVPALIKYMEDGKMKQTMAGSYERLGKKKMADKLDKEGRGMVADATGALERTTSENYGPDLEKWKKWWQENKHKYGPPIPLRQYTANPSGPSQDKGPR